MKPPTRWRALGATATEASGSALVTGASPDQAAAAAAVAVVHQLAVEVVQRNEQRAAWTLMLSADELGMTIPELAGKVRSDPRLLRLAAAVLEASGATVLEAKVRYLAGLLGEGLRQPSHADVARVQLSVVADLEEPHLHVMELLTTAPPERRKPDEPPKPEDGWTREQVQGELPASTEVVEIITAVLARHSLIADVSGQGFFGYEGRKAERWALTEVGRRTLTDLKAAAITISVDR